VSEYLSQYGTEDRTRERVVRAILIAMAAIAVLWAVDWGLAAYGTYTLRDAREEYRAHSFFSQLGKQRYREAYAMWGCDEAHPCRDYSYQKFMEDWGPKSPAADLSKRKVLAVRHCNGSIIEVIDLGTGDPLNLIVDSHDLALSFAPWPVCNPRWQPN